MDVPNTSKRLLPGMVAEVHIPLPANASTFVVPKKTILETAEGIFVLKNNNNKIEKIEVKKGREADDRIEIFGDLKADDELVTNPSEEMQTGQVIQP
jgi:hypothetical protein